MQGHSQVFLGEVVVGGHKILSLSLVPKILGFKCKNHCTLSRDKNKQLVSFAQAISSLSVV